MPNLPVVPEPKLTVKRFKSDRKSVLECKLQEYIDKAGYRENLRNISTPEHSEVKPVTIKTDQKVLGSLERKYNHELGSEICYVKAPISSIKHPKE